MALSRNMRSKKRKKFNWIFIQFKNGNDFFLCRPKEGGRGNNSPWRGWGNLFLNPLLATNGNKSLDVFPKIAFLNTNQPTDRRIPGIRSSRFFFQNSKFNDEAFSFSNSFPSSLHLTHLIPLPRIYEPKKICILGVDFDTMDTLL